MFSHAHMFMAVCCTFHGQKNYGWVHQDYLRTQESSNFTNINDGPSEHSLTPSLINEIFSLH